MASRSEHHGGSFIRECNLQAIHNNVHILLIVNNSLIMYASLDIVSSSIESLLICDLEVSLERDEHVIV